ncbi:MAG TPA: GDSL-type esterase/lipase family protein [Opitutaceae bacterium]|nr:GDSL-type esterase/lipase family protein [Opitutaceae bacterium]
MNPPRVRWTLVLLAACSLASAAPAQAPSAPARLVDATSATPKVGNPDFYEKHARHLRRARSGPVGLLFLGDSITEGWNGVADLWQERYGAHQPANFGIGGDQTHHVIWRIEHGELATIKPQVVVLMIGTNNSAMHSGAEIAAADTKIVRLIREKLPETKVLLLAIFPRAARPAQDGSITDSARADAEKRMAAIRVANAEIAKLDDGAHVRFLDIGPKFLAPDGSIPREIMPDQLHLSPAGYRIWAEAMQPLLDEMLAPR